MALTWSISSFHFQLLFLPCLHLIHFKKCVFLSSFLHWSDCLLNFSKIYCWFYWGISSFSTFLLQHKFQKFYSIARVVVLITLRNYGILYTSVPKLSFCIQQPQRSFVTLPKTTRHICSALQAGVTASRLLNLTLETWTI